MIMENDIIFIALSEQILKMQHILENQLYPDEESKILYTYLLEESEKLIDKYIPTNISLGPIQKPKF